MNWSVHLDLLPGNQARVSCLGPVSRSLSLAGRFTSLVSVGFKNIFKLKAQEGSQGSEQALPGLDTQKHGNQISTHMLPAHF